MSVEAFATTGALLAGLDPALPHLGEVMAEASRTPGFIPHDARWTPGERCVLAYRVTSPAGTDTFAAWEVTPDGSTRHDYRADPALPGLARAADEAAVGDLLAARLDTGVVRGCVIEPVRYRPGSRCVLRYQLRTDAGVHVMYAKVFRPTAKAAAETAGKAAPGVPAVLTELATAAPPWLLAQLVVTWPEHAVLVHEGVEGRRLSDLLRDPAVPTRVRVRLAYRLGTLLARLHSQQVAAPDRTAADVLQVVSESLAAARQADPPVGRRLTAALDRLSSWQPTGGEQVLGHGGFRPGQVVAAENRLTILDLDGVCRCDAERDLGAALAHLLWQGVRHAGERSTVEAAARAFVAGYERRAGRVDPDALAWWRSLALVSLAARRYRRLELSGWRRVPALLDGLERLVAAIPTRTSAPLAGHLLDRHAMTRALRPELAPVAAEPADLDVTAARLIKHAPGRRTVLRYTVRGLRPGVPTQLVGKLFVHPHRAALADANLRALADGPFKGDGALRVPEPLPSPLERGLMLYRHCAGVHLDRLDGMAAIAGVRAAARWLARLHGCDVILPRRLDLSVECAGSRGWASLVADREPDLLGLVWRLADGWARAAQLTPLGADVPIHKDFHAGHVLVDVAVTVIDLDEVRMGDPALDVAHFCAYLDLRADPAHAGALRRAFLEEYVATAGRPDLGRTALFSAYTWLKIAKQLVLGTGPHRCPEGPARTREVARALQRGLECLDT
ncbi:phosphotransferase [Actinopolymorpha rutila]|uniref:Aminoglycoside phosphotransferase (APT) family kinase protein n=1 Tax=Actinopolymorpha rutila TaxID=446787 RepID=A0A852ZGI5_9ACTN|nr:aminoglycoside phosphotransferase (APT) family kinase protein [Actinopolymorpha rutila]